MRLYHGTLKRYMPDIRKRGLEPSSGVVMGTDAVFLATNIKSAEYWAKYHWGCFTEYKEEGLCDIVVLAVEIPVYQADMWLKPDVEQFEDYHRELTFENLDDLDWKEAYEKGQDLMFTMDIPPEWIVEEIGDF